METINATTPGSLERAIAIAVAAHAGTVDKAGAPYILHPLRVMLRLPDTLARIVGVLHDVVEDHGDIWPESRLRELGFGDDVLDALRSVTKRADEEAAKGAPYEEKLACYLRFVRRAAAHPVGRRVKLADLDDNLDITRLPGVSEKDARHLDKYLAARAELLAALH